MYDLTKGNYRVLRTVSYPAYPESKIRFDVQVTAIDDLEWDTKINIEGMYSGPTDFISQKDYQLTWIAEREKILEQGSMTLELSSGEFVRSTWTSEIIPEVGFNEFPLAGEFINVTMSPFKIDGNTMSYDWKGTVEEKSK